MDISEPRTHSAPATPARQRLTFAVLAVSAVSFALVQSLVIPVLSTIRAALHTSGSGVAWLVTGYLLTASIATPILGRLGDMYGKQRMLVVALALLATGSVVAALAPSISVMIGARAVQGLGGGVLPLGFGIVRDEFPDASVPSAVGVLSSLTAAGAGVGLVVAGPLVSTFGFRSLFWLPGIAVGLAAIAAHLLVAESPVRDRDRLRWTPAVLLATWLLALLLAVSKSRAWGWGSPAILLLLAVAAAALACWVLVELRSPAPLIDMTMMRLRTVWTVNAVALTMGAGLFAVYAFTPTFLQTSTAAGYGFGVSVGTSGLMLLPQSIASFGTGVASGALTRRFSARRLLLVALLANAASFALLAIVHDHEWQVVVELTVLGLTFGTILAGMASLVVEAVPANQTGVASGMNANIRTIGGAIGTAIGASLIASHEGAGGLPSEAGYTHAYLLLGAISLLGAMAAVLIPGVEATHRLALPHAELGVVAGGTLSGADPE